MKKILTFNLAKAREAGAFGHVIQTLNMNGVPYAVSNLGTEATIEIGDGY